MNSNKEPSIVDVSQDSTLTPISKEEVPKVNRRDWDEMEVSKLYEQLEILENRYYMSLNLKQIDMANQINRGIEHIRLLISRKSTKTNMFY